MIHKRLITQKIKIKTLFDNLQIPEQENAAKIPDFDLRVKTPYGYQKICNLFRTEKQKSVTCYFGNNKTLKTSLKHRLRANNEWKHVDEILDTDIIETETGVTYLKHKQVHTKYEILYDISVENVHCYYSNGILSHNSWSLVNIGAGALRRGMRVLHFTLELDESYTSKRYDSFFTGHSSANLKYYIEDVKDAVEKLPGELIIKYYPNKTATVTTIRAQIEHMIAIGQKPDLVIVDYADLLRPISITKHDRNDMVIGSIYDDLRGVAGEYRIPIFTASQSGRSSADDDIITGDKIAEAFSKLFVADFVVSLSRKTNDKIAGTGRWHIIKNRFGPDGLTFPSKINFATGKVEIFEQTTVEGKETQKMIDNDQEYVRKYLGTKFKEMKS